jgi:hypothetical protein
MTKIRGFLESAPELVQVCNVIRVQRELSKGSVKSDEEQLLITGNQRSVGNDRVHGIRQITDKSRRRSCGT